MIKISRIKISIIPWLTCSTLFLAGCIPPLNFRHSLSLCSPEPSRIKEIVIYYDGKRAPFTHLPKKTTGPTHDSCGIGGMSIDLAIPKQLTIAWMTTYDNKSYTQTINIDRSMLTIKSTMRWQIRIEDTNLELWRETNTYDNSPFTGPRIVEKVFP